MRTDTDIEADVQEELSWSPDVDETDIAVKANGGVVTLTGFARSYGEKYQAEPRALDAVRRCAGVVGLANLIEIKPKIVPQDIKHRIEEAFRRSAEVDAHGISVEAKDGAVTLRGRVRSLAERDEAQYTAWSAPGVRHVRNEITVGL